jgi:anti-sigma B factor antagonist
LIIIDFKMVTYINSAGIAILVSLVTEAEKGAGKLLFSGLVPHYRRVMEIVGITDYVGCFDSVEDAIQSRGSRT